MRSLRELGLHVLGQVEQELRLHPLALLRSVGMSRMMRHVRPAALDRDLADAADVVGGQPVAAKLIGQRAGDEAVGDDDLPRLQRRQDRLAHHLRPRGHVEQHLAAHGHVGVVGVEQDAADQLADARGAGVVHGERPCSPAASRCLPQQRRLRALAAPFAAVEDDELAAEVMSCRLDAVVQIGRDRCRRNYSTPCIASTALTLPTAAP